MPGTKLIRVALLMFSMFVALAVTRTHHTAVAEPAPSVGGPADSRVSVLVMRDGGVLTGQITQSGERYIVVHGGAEISVAAVNVAIVCRTLEEAYRRQRSEMQSPTAESHLKLAEWCLGSGLYPQAADELVAARGLDPRHAKLELLERRLTVVGRPAPEKRSSIAAETLASASAAPASSSAESPVSSADLPDGVVERFTRKVQPLLVNNCTMAGCHRPGGEQSFELDRALLHGMANRRSTMHNLAAVLTLVDRERPQESPLLTIPRRDHGGMNRPIFGPRHSLQYQQLVDWVGMVTQSNAAADVAPATDAPRTADSLVIQPPRWSEPVEAASFDDIMPPFQPSTPRYGARLRSWEPKDPFDPEIFNRQTRQAAPTTR